MNIDIFFLSIIFMAASKIQSLKSNKIGTGKSMQHITGLPGSILFEQQCSVKICFSEILIIIYKDCSLNNSVVYIATKPILLHLPAMPIRFQKNQIIDQMPAKQK